LPQMGRELAPAGKDDERAYLRSNATSYAHAAGTCRMGVEPGAGAVVNAEGRVYGLDNVWVADASIMPRLPRANTNLACYLIGYRMAEVIAGRLPRSRSEHPQPIV
jgi:choline dehydrogenase-like flavoprotein